VGAATGEGVDQADRVADQVGARVAGHARRVADRAAGVAVVPDDKPATRSQPPAEPGGLPFARTDARQDPSHTALAPESPVRIT
jgi:hypothetical protein